MRLAREHKQMTEQPDEDFVAHFDELNDDILTWYFVFKGATQTPYEGGIYMGKLIFKLLLVVVLPAVLGLWIKATREPVAQRLSPGAHRVATVLMFVMLAGLIYTNFGLLREQKFVAIAAGVVFFPLAFAIGRLFGGPMPGNARALGIMSAVRNGALSLLFATQIFVQTPAVLVMVTMMAVLSAAIMIPLGILLERRPITAGARV